MKRQSVQRRPRQQTLIDLPEPTLTCFEEQLFSQGLNFIAGVDEAGRGCLAGPVVAAAVILPKNCKIQGINDSKQLTAPERERLFDTIINDAVAFGIGVVGPREIDKINILESSRKAMRIAVDGLSKSPDYILVDGPFGIRHEIPQRPIKKGDLLSLSIAAASIIAKVSRDRMMCELEDEFPKFQFSIHKGYGTKLHLGELKQNGPTPAHRMTFRGVK